MEGIDEVFRRHAPEVLASLIRRVGDFDLAEEALQEAFAAAASRWPTSPPDNPKAWLARVARNKAVDAIRGRIAFRAREADLKAEAELAQAIEDAEPEETAGEDMLRLIFTCCHPALSLEARIALTLKVVCGLSTEAVARAFLVPEETMAQRLVRAKAKIRLAGIPYVIPPKEDLPERLEGVLAVLYLVFTEAYAGDPGRSLAGEAIALARRLEALIPGRAVEGLLALMLLHDARRAARTDAAGDLVLLEDQDRSLWDKGQIAEGLELVERSLRRPRTPSPYAVQAAIAALHARAPSGAETDWPQIVGLYDVLMLLTPTPVVALNRAAAVAMAEGLEAGLLEMEALAQEGSLKGYYLLPAARADLLRRSGRLDEARAAYREALALAPMEADRRLLRRRLEETR
jgi:RNA polymerase sigma-70 factor (ECF subfamily)